MFIESEDRYLWKKETRINEEYLLRENFGNKHVDYNDYIYTEYIKTYDKPYPIEGRIIESETVYKTYNENDVKGIRLSKYLKVGDYFISEIELLEKDTKKPIEYEIDEEYSFLFDGSYSQYKKFDDVIIKFKNKRTIDNILLKIYYKSDIAINSLLFSYISEDYQDLYSAEYETNGTIFEINEEDLTSNLQREVTTYLYKDKLYKTYELKEEVTTEYYTEMPGYEKIEDSKKTYYRYIMNDYVLLGPFGYIVENADYCLKNFCQVAYIEEQEIKKEEPVVETPKEESKEEPKVEQVKEDIVEDKEEPKEVIIEEKINPKTIDHINIFIIIMIVSLVSLIVLYRKKIYLVLSNRFKLK